MLWKIVITWVNFKHCVDGRKRENRSHARHGLVCSGSNTYKRHTLFDYVQFPLEPGRRQYLPSKRKKSIFPEKVVKSQWFCIIFREVVVIWRIILIVKIVQFLSKKFVNLRRVSPIVLENVVIWRIILTLKIVTFLSKLGFTRSLYIVLFSFSIFRYLTMRLILLLTSCLHLSVGHVVEKRGVVEEMGNLFEGTVFENHSKISF